MIWPLLEAHLAKFVVIQTHLSCLFRLGKIRGRLAQDLIGLAQFSVLPLKSFETLLFSGRRAVSKTLDAPMKSPES